MLAPVVLVVLIAQAANAGGQGRPLEPASAVPDPVTREQPWPPAGVFRPGGDVTQPKVIKRPFPEYPSRAMKSKVQGRVFMEAVVLTDGTVGEVRDSFFVCDGMNSEFVVRSLTLDSNVDGGVMTGKSTPTPTTSGLLLVGLSPVCWRRMATPR